MDQSPTMSPRFEEIISMEFPDTAPLPDLPNELLAEIFKFSIPNPLIIPWRPSERNLPWTLFHVSTRWRSIALGLPELWGNISIDYDNKVSTGGTELEPEVVTRIAHGILSRSGNVPLSLRIKAIAFDPDKCDPGCWDHLVDLISRHAHRIRYLHLYLQDLILWDVLESPPYDFKCLEFLSLVSTDDEYIEQMYGVFRKAPCLRVAELGLCFDWSFARPELAWANLTHLSITKSDSELSPFAAHQVIRQCPSLITLQITLQHDDQRNGAFDGNIPLMTFLSLKTLLVQLKGCTMMAEFLKPLILPRLTRLELTSSDSFGYTRRWDYVAALLVISNYQLLDNLKITLPIPDDYDMESLFKFNPNLIELRLPPLSQSTLLFLSSGKWLPKLQVVEVSVTLESLDAHVNMLNNRAEGGFSTRWILVWHTRTERKKFQARSNGEEDALIKKLKDTGLLRLTSQKRRNAQMRDFIPIHMKI